MPTLRRADPDSSAVPWLPITPLPVAVAGATVLALLHAGLAVAIGRSAPAAAAVAVSWVVASVVAQPSVQARLGGGRLDTRVALRMSFAALLFGVFTTGFGAGFLLPVVLATAASVHVHWSGAEAWRTCATVMTVATVAAQVLVVLGAVRPVVGTGQSLALAAIALTAVLAALAHLGHVSLHRDRTTRDLERAARLDPLTGVLSRSAFLADLERLVPLVRPGAGTGLLFCDLDGFKDVNDVHGHRAGDLVLARTARRVLAAVPVGALVGRVGGDEFLVAVPGTAGPALLDEVVQSVRRATRQPVRLDDGTEVTAEVTVGAAWTDDPNRSADDLVAAADAAMYARKRRR